MANTNLRTKKYKESLIPYSFIYKTRLAFTGELCPICNNKMINGMVKRIPTVQHCMPLSMGGRHELDNIAVICHRCNVTIRNTPTCELNNKLVVRFWEKTQNKRGISLERLELYLQEAKKEVECL